MIVGACLVTLSSGTVSAEPRYEVQVTKYLMDTQIDATVICADIVEGKRALLRAFQEIERLDGLLGYDPATSDVERVNERAGHAPVRVSGETFALLKRARGYANDFGGLFDVTIGAITDIWGFASGEPHRPPETAIKARSLLVDARRMTLLAADTTVYLPEPGMRLDLGGIAKGYAIDRAAHILREHGLTDFLLNAGGDVYVSGTNRERAPWRVGIKHPRRPQALLATLELTDHAIATSGDYERYFEEEGRRFHHIIDPRTGLPGDLSQSATVLAPTAELADVLATVLFLRGGRDGTTHAHSIQNYVLVTTDGDVTCDSTLFERRNLVVKTDGPSITGRGSGSAP